MLICHKLDVSSGAAVLQACIRQTCITVITLQWLACNNRQCLSCQRRERLCAAERLIKSYLSFLVS